MSSLTSDICAHHQVENRRPLRFFAIASGLKPRARRLILPFDMSRSHRCAPANVVFHVLNRGNQRQNVFADWRDYRGFCNLLREAAARYSVRVLAYCLMPNHWHLIVWPEADATLSLLVHDVCTQHAMAYRRRTQTVGAGYLYQDRFRCFAVETSDYYFRALRYVEGNAARAGLVGRAEHWRWSSAYARATGAAGWLSPGPLDLPRDWLALVNQELPHTELTRLRTSVRRERPYGPGGWREDMARQLDVIRSVRSRGRPRRVVEFSAAAIDYLPI